MSGPTEDGLVVLVAATSPVLRHLRDVLRDWVAVGLVRPFLWIDEADVDPDRPMADVVASHVTAAAAARVRLSDHLADRHAPGLVRLVPVSTTGAGPAIVSPRVAGHLYTGLNGIRAVHISPVHCVLTRHGKGGWAPGPVWTGWHTVVVAPEDAWTPALVATDLTYGHDDSGYHSHAAAALTSLVGLWTGVGEAPFDGLITGTQSRPIAARAFLRRLDASAVAAQLRRALTDLSAGLPRPRHGQARSEHLRRPDAAAVRTAAAVLHRHRGLLAIRRATPGADVRQQVGALAALRMFLGFLSSAVRRAPWTLYSNVRSQASAAVSRRLQSAIFGTGDSRYEVVTAGVTAAGLPVGADDLARSAEELARRVYTVAPEAEQPGPDAAPFWRDVIDGALTLADGGQRCPEIPPVMVGAVPGIVPDASFLAPSPDTTFELSSQLAAVLGVNRIRPHDIRAQDEVSERLRAAGGDVEMGRTADRFEAWRREVGGAYTSEIGRRLAGELRERTEAAAGLLGDLHETTADTGNPTPTRDDQLVVVRVVGAMVAVLVVVGAAVAVVLLNRWLTLRYTLGLAAIVTITWQAPLLYRLYRRQQRIFAMLTSRNAARHRKATAAGNLGYAVNELHVAAVLYQQYLAWTPILGRFLLAPFGAVPQPAPPPRLAGGLPRAMGLGIAHPNPDQIAAVAHDLRSVVFDPGWLSHLWNGFLDDAPGRLGHAGFAVRGNPALLLADEAATPASPLRMFSDVVVADGVSGTAGDALWRRARHELLARGGDTLASRLFGDVEVVGQAGPGASERMPGSTFLTDLVAAVEDERAGHFSTSLFEPASVTYESHKVGSTVVIGGTGFAGVAETTSTAHRWLPPGPGEDADLDQFVVVVQMTDPLPVDHLRLLAPLVTAATAVGPAAPVAAEAAVVYPDLGI